MARHVVVLGGGVTGRGLRRRAAPPRRGRPNHARRARAGRRRVLLLGLHPLEDAAAPARGRRARAAHAGVRERSARSTPRQVFAWRDEISEKDDTSQVEWLEKLGAELVRGTRRRRRARPRHASTDGSSPTTSCSSRPARSRSMPPIEGLEDAAHWTSREATSASEVPESLARRRRRRRRLRARAVLRAHGRHGDARARRRPPAAAGRRRGRRRSSPRRSRRRASRSASTRTATAGRGRRRTARCRLELRGRRARRGGASCSSPPAGGRTSRVSGSSGSSRRSDEAGIEVDDRLCAPARTSGRPATSPASRSSRTSASTRRRVAAANIAGRGAARRLPRDPGGDLHRPAGRVRRGHERRRAPSPRAGSSSRVSRTATFQQPEAAGARQAVRRSRAPRARRRRRRRARGRRVDRPADARDQGRGPGRRPPRHHPAVPDLLGGGLLRGARPGVCSLAR